MNENVFGEYAFQRQTAKRQYQPKLREKQRGGALVELALTAPALFMLMIGIAEFGRFAYMSIAVADAARAGVQYGAQNHIKASDATGMRNAATADRGNVPGIAAVAIHSCKCLNGNPSTCLPTDCSGSQIVEFVQVSTTATVAPMFNYPGISRSLTLHGQAIMRVEQ